MVERNLAKVEVESSRLFSRSTFLKGSLVLPFFHSLEILRKACPGYGAVAKRLCPGLQIRLVRFDSGPRLQKNHKKQELSDSPRGCDVLAKVCPSPVHWQGLECMVLRRWFTSGAVGLEPQPVDLPFVPRAFCPSIYLSAPIWPDAILARLCQKCRHSQSGAFICKPLQTRIWFRLR